MSTNESRNQASDAAATIARPIMEVEGVTKRYGGTVALDGVSLSVLPGEVHTVVGENGAGKSTLMKIMAGAVEPNDGTVKVGSEQMTEHTPQEASARGVGVIYQELNMIPYLSVSANVALGQEDRRGPFLKSSTIREKAEKTFEEMGVEIDPDAIVGDLSVAKRQLVEIAKALSQQQVKVLIMDEPTSALASEEVDSLFELIRRLKDQGVAIIYISHRFDEIFEISDRVSVLRDGKYVDTQPIGELDHDTLVRLMVGRELSMVHRDRASTEEVALKVIDACSEGRIEDVSFSLRQGELLGVAGLLGAGRTELAEVLFGLAPMDSGHVELLGRKVDHIRSPRHAISLGLGLVPEDRQRQGLVAGLSCTQNIVLSTIRRLTRRGFVQGQEERRVAGEYKDKLRIKYNEGQVARELSGGNQQKLVAAKVLATRADVLIFDEPTRGVDIGAKQDIYRLMDELLDEGKSIIMISSEMDEILNLSDRILVMREGRVAGTLNREEATQEKILALASGVETNNGGVS